jgi:hypothetical protein
VFGSGSAFLCFCKPAYDIAESFGHFVLTQDGIATARPGALRIGPNIRETVSFCKDSSRAAG